MTLRLTHLLYRGRLLVCGVCFAFVTILGTAPASGHALPSSGAAGLACTSLQITTLSSRQVRFVAHAHAANTQITRYVFSFGDGQSGTIRTSQESASIVHTYPAPTDGASANVVVYSTNFPGGHSSRSCAVSVTTVNNTQPTQPAPVQSQSSSPTTHAHTTVAASASKSLTCDSLTAQRIAGNNRYALTAHATARGMEIVWYKFIVSNADSGLALNTPIVGTSANSATVRQTFSSQGGTYRVRAIVSGDSIVNATSPACMTTIRITPPVAKAAAATSVTPSPPAAETNATSAETSTSTEQAETSEPAASTTLPNTGSGLALIGFAAFGLTFAASSIGARLYLRRH